MHSNSRSVQELLAVQNLKVDQILSMLWYNRPRLIYQYFNMAPRLSGQTSIIWCFLSIQVSFGNWETKETWKTCNFDPKSPEPCWNIDISYVAYPTSWVLFIKLNEHTVIIDFRKNCSVHLWMECGEFHGYKNHTVRFHFYFTFRSGCEVL